MTGTQDRSARERVEEQTRIRKALLANGYTPLANRDKMCVLTGWPGLNVDDAVIDGWADQLRYPATGIRVDGRLVVLDFDIDDSDMLDAVFARLDKGLRGRLAAAPQRYGRGEKVAIFLRLADGETVFGRLVSQGYAPPGAGDDAVVMRVEAFGSGTPRQFGAYGPHSHAPDGSVVLEYDWGGDQGLVETPLHALPEITVEEVKAVCDAASAAMLAGGWEYEVRTHEGAVDDRPVFDLDDDMVFVTAEHGVMDLSGLEALCGAVDSVRLSASWLEGPTARTTSRCIARLHPGDGRLQIWESASCVVHRLRTLDVKDKLVALGARLQARGAGVEGAVEGEEGGGAEGDGLTVLERLLAAVPEDKRLFGGPVAAGGGGGSGSGGDDEEDDGDARPFVDVSAGEMHIATVQTALALAATDYMFLLGGRLVGVIDGEVREMTEARLALELSAMFRCVTLEQRGKKVVPVKAHVPQALVKQVLAFADEAGFRQLRGIVDMPVLVDGAVVSEGYVESAQLLVTDVTGAGALVEGGSGGDRGGDDIRAALETVWSPFREFPFVGPGAMGGMLACILTAVARAWLPTAPMFAFDAPVQGSGKSLLCRAVGALSGRCMFSAPLPLKNEDEIRKRLMSMLVAGPSAVIYDNQIGTLDSAALAAVLTSETFADRELGKSRILNMPTNVLVMVNGNNLALGGDMPRRSVRVRIDPQMDTPFERRFDFDPETWVRANRGRMVAAALTLLRWGMAASGGGRIGSFERWDEVVGQTVARIGREIDPRFGDPADVIRSAHEDDPRRDELGDLLTALRDEFGNRWFTASEVSSRMAGAGATAPLVEAFGYDKVPSTRSIGRHLTFRRDARMHGMTIQLSTDSRANVRRFRVWAEDDADDVVVRGALEERRAEQKARLGGLVKPGG